VLVEAPPGLFSPGCLVQSSWEGPPPPLDGMIVGDTLVLPGGFFSRGGGFFSREDPRGYFINFCLHPVGVSPAEGFYPYNPPGYFAPVYGPPPL